MSVELELERTFLARYIPAQIDGAASDVIVDTYIPETAEHALLRLRKRGAAEQARYEMTKKVPLSGNDSSQQTEHTIPLSGEEYEVFARTSKKTISKRRFYCTVYGRKAEVDVFMDDLDGLIMIDFEFASLQEMQMFQPPEACLAEVTQDALTAGGKLAGRTYADIDFELRKYHYEPLYMDKEDSR